MVIKKILEYSIMAIATLLYKIEAGIEAEALPLKAKRYYSYRGKILPLLFVHLNS